MKAHQREMLERIRAAEKPAFSETASALLDGSLHWPDDEIDRFIDGFMNDPYLTRNPGDRP